MAKQIAAKHRDESSSVNARHKLEYLDYEQYERQVSDSRMKYMGNLLDRLDRHLNGRDFMQVNRADVQAFLLQHKKSEEEDPEHKWIGTYNSELSRLEAFYRWLYNKGKDPEDWITPDCLKIKKLQRAEDSSYSENDIWSQDDVLFIATKVADSVRDAFVVTALYDFAAINKEMVNLRMKNTTLNEKYGEASISAKNRSRVVPLLLSYVFARDLINSHPFRDNPDAFLLVNEYSSKRLKPTALWHITDRLKQKLHRMVETGEFTGADLEHAKKLLKKKWNPYCMGRHSTLSEKSDFMTEWQLKRYAGWSLNSKVPKRYLHKKDVVKPILQHYGIVDDEQGRKQIVINACPKCQFVNKPNVKFCEKCSYILDPTAWEEMKKQEQEQVMSTVQSVVTAQLKSLHQTYDTEIKQIAQEVVALKKAMWKEKGLDPQKESVADLKNGVTNLESIAVNMVSKFDSVLSKVPEKERDNELWKKVAECKDMWIAANDECKKVHDKTNNIKNQSED